MEPPKPLASLRFDFPPSVSAVSGSKNGDDLHSTSKSNTQKDQRPMDERVRTWRRKESEAVPESDTTWSCPRCTLDNPQENRKCEACCFAPPEPGPEPVPPKKNRKSAKSSISGYFFKRSKKEASKTSKMRGNAKRSPEKLSLSSSSSTESTSERQQIPLSSRLQLSLPNSNDVSKGSSSAFRRRTKAKDSTSSKEAEAGSGSGKGSKMWTLQYKPNTRQDLCLNAKKIDQVCGWMKNAESLGMRFLLLTGPSGCGKSTLVRVLAKELGLHVSCWTENCDAAIRKVSESRTFAFNELPRTNKMDSFRSFLLRGKYSSIVNRLGPQPRTQRQLVLIEDIPYVGRQEYKDEFRDILLNSLQGRDGSFMVMIGTDDHENNNKVTRLLGDEFLSHPKVGHIAMNAVNFTCMKKALERIASAEGISLARADCKEIHTSSRGDLRNAILSLQMAATPQENEIIDLAADEKVSKGVVRKRQRGGRKKKQKERGRAISLDPAIGGLDNAFSIFHAIGKILYKKEGMAPEDVIATADMSPEKFTEWLQWNCLDHLLDLGTETETNSSFGGSFDFANMEEEADLASDGLSSACDVLLSMSTADTLTSMGKSLNYGNQICPVESIYGASVASRSFLETDTTSGAKANTKKKRGKLSMRGPKAANLLWDVERKARSTRRLMAGTNAFTHYSPTAVFTEILPYSARVGPHALQTETFQLSPRQIEALLRLNSYSQLNRPRPYWGPGVSKNSSSAYMYDDDDELDCSALVLEDDDIVVVAEDKNISGGKKNMSGGGQVSDRTFAKPKPKPPSRRRVKRGALGFF
mmetsp:Transcript_22774/g.40303  ORF Transcript_22774/g.40303 Transcript_22774/m.40303 type:complete len:810 (+) Transcript_22774:19-2448(+)